MREAEATKQSRKKCSGQILQSLKNEIVDQMEDDTYKIRIAAPATDNKANNKLIKFLKKSLGVSEVIIVSGQKDRIKLLRIQ